MINNHIISWVRKIKQISASPRNPKPGSTDNAGISVNSVSGIICNTLGLGVFCLHQKQLAGWLFWVERPFETVFQSISGRPPERWRKREENINESKNVQRTSTCTYCKRNRPLPYYHPNCRTPRHWKFTQDHRTNRPPPHQKQMIDTIYLHLNLMKDTYNPVI